jgi:hypothetical protein
LGSKGIEEGKFGNGDGGRGDSTQRTQRKSTEGTEWEEGSKTQRLRSFGRGGLRMTEKGRKEEGKKEERMRRGKKRGAALLGAAPRNGELGYCAGVR